VIPGVCDVEPTCRVYGLSAFIEASFDERVTVFYDR